MAIQKEFGSRIKQLRLKKGISREIFAELDRLLRTYITSIENDKGNVTLLNFQKITDALESKITELFNSKESQALSIEIPSEIISF